ncbi:tyrosine-type recombinase/integrase [Enterobacter asburiae]|uniref:tyrosine-type recombinase/integrase n=1 Tax=Enterobacter asburiae TaxID=61645 RepID=UPI00192CA7A7|nr:tyrosine-type recombinase/integrase [Enterobacter asburiae]MBL5924998.1 phage integrase Arm DNA-binding domain-containing protein [Enterobacter asburiae]MBL5956371.1 phage integrase Arm DNA-binding domain-containing protein [Enterobacter asburiae]
MARPDKYDANLPKNLTYRKARKTYAWRNPLDGKEIPLGNISRREAISQAIEANHYIEKNYTPIALLEQLKGTNEYTMANWLDRYEVILQRRKLAANTYKVRAGQLATIGEHLGPRVLANITTRHVAEFLERWTACGKTTMAGTMRSVLSDVFREAVVEGRVDANPVTPTRAPKIEVLRERLEYEMFVAVRAGAERMPAWFGLAMDLALVTGQRREDVAGMRFSDIKNDRLYIEQQKTGACLALPLSLTLKEAGLRLGTVIDRCKLVSRCDFLISPGIRKNSEDGSINLDSLTKGFVKARNFSGVIFTDNPPSFHEIRSLAGRMYEKDFGKEFAQKLLGHKSEKMTEKYLDSRKKEYVMI